MGFGLWKVEEGKREWYKGDDEKRKEDGYLMEAIDVVRVKENWWAAEQRERERGGNWSAGRRSGTLKSWIKSWTMLRTQENSVPWWTRPLSPPNEPGRNGSQLLGFEF